MEKMGKERESFQEQNEWRHNSSSSSLPSKNRLSSTMCKRCNKKMMTWKHSLLSFFFSLSSSFLPHDHTDTAELEKGHKHGLFRTSASWEKERKKKEGRKERKEKERNSNPTNSLELVSLFLIHVRLTFALDKKKKERRRKRKKRKNEEDTNSTETSLMSTLFLPLYSSGFFLSITFLPFSLPFFFLFSFSNDWRDEEVEKKERREHWRHFLLPVKKYTQ